MFCKIQDIETFRIYELNVILKCGLYYLYSETFPKGSQETAMHLTWDYIN